MKYLVKRFSRSSKEKEKKGRSTNKKSDEDKDLKKKGSAIVLGGLAANTALGSIFLRKKSPNAEDTGLSNKMTEKVKKEGSVNVYDNHGYNSFYMSKDESEKYKGVHLYRPQDGMDMVGGDPGKLGSIYISKDHVSPGTIGHEYGHAKNSGTVLGRLAQSKLSREGNSKAPIIGFGAGFAGGVNSVRNEAKGEKEGWLSRNAHWVAPVVSSAPTVIEEAAASARGLKDLRSLGATKDQVRRNAADLGVALGTYAAAPVIGIGAGYLGRRLGKKVGRDIYRKELKERESSDSEKDKKSNN